MDSTHEDTRRARGWVSESLSELGCDADFTGDVLLALGEALTNVVRHGYAGRCGNPIDVTIVVAPEWVEILLEDEAPTFAGSDEGRLPDPTALAEGGYGIYLMQSLMDEMRREPRGETGNRLRLRKYRSGREGGRMAS